MDDIDVEGRERHLVSRRRVIPLPLLRANPVTHPEAIFPKGTLVNALYPQTTCFYRYVHPHLRHYVTNKNPAIGNSTRGI